MTKSMPTQDGSTWQIEKRRNVGRRGKESCVKKESDSCIHASSNICNTDVFGGKLRKGRKIKKRGGRGRILIDSQIWGVFITRGMGVAAV